MAAIDTLIQILQGNKVGLRQSKELEVWLKALGIGTSNIQVTDNAGVLEVAAKLKVQEGTAPGEVVTKNQLDTASGDLDDDVSAIDGRLTTVEGTLDGHLNGSASRHDLTESDYERLAGSRKDIQATSNDGETALTDLDDNKISKNGLIAFAADQSMGGNRLTDLGVPTAAGDAVNKDYADAIAAGVDPKAEVQYSTASNIASILSANQATVEAALDTVSAVAPTLVVDDRIVVRHQIDPVQNGIYRWTGTELVRASDFDGTPANEVSGGARTFVLYGDEYGNTAYVVVWTGDVVVDTDPINWTTYNQNAINPGSGLVQNGNAFDVNVDDATIETVGNVVRVKDAGISLDKLAADSVDETKIKSSALGSELTGGSGAVLNVETTQAAVNNSGSAILAGRLVFLKDVANVMEMELADKDNAGADGRILGVLVATTDDGNTGQVIVRPGTKVAPSLGGGAFEVGKPVYVGVGGAATQTMPTGVKPYRLGRAIGSAMVRLDQELLIPYPGFIDIKETVAGAPKTSFVLSGVTLTAGHSVDAFIDGRLNEDVEHFTKNVGTNSIDFTVAVAIGRRVVIRVYLK